MKGLEQAVNIQSWPGNGLPAKAWGRLKQDPELWDECGDTLVFFARGRPEPSFRIQSCLLRDTKSDVLIDMLLTALVRSGTPGTPPGVSHKLYMDPPPAASKLDVLRHHITTRNFFAFLARKPLVGFTFYQALVDLHDRLEEYLTRIVDPTEVMKSYLVSLGLVNVSNEPRAAAGLLAWSEDVRWNEGWREAFTHSVGMWEQLNTLQESADISFATKAHLDRAHLDLQARVHAAENLLSTFYFDDAHYSQEDLSPNLRAASERFRKFLRQFYEKQYQSWPIKRKPDELCWLDRQIVCELKHDFNCLYEYCVDRNITLSGQSVGAGQQKCRNVLKSKDSQDFRPDCEDDRMMGVFRNFDCRNNNVGIPHPYPLLPESLPAPAASKKSIFKNKKPDKARESRVAYGYASASNASQLHQQFTESDLYEAFIRFEKTDLASEIDPREARRERWIIIYCVLQTLASISIDVPHLTYKSNVTYFLNTRLRGLPPWSPEERLFEEASLEHSHCWTFPPNWADTRYERPDRNHSSSSGPGHSRRSKSSSSTRRFLDESTRRLNENGSNGISIEEYGPLAPEPHQSRDSSHILAPFLLSHPGVRALSEGAVIGPKGQLGSFSSAGRNTSLLSSLYSAAPPAESVPSLIDTNGSTDQSSRSDNSQDLNNNHSSNSRSVSVSNPGGFFNSVSSSSGKSTSTGAIARPTALSSLPSSKFSALAGLEEYSHKPLPTRPGRMLSDRVKKGMEGDDNRRYPKR